MDVRYITARVAVFFILLSIALFNCGCKSPSSANPFPYTPDDFSNPVREILKKIERQNIVYLNHSACRADGSIYDSALVYHFELASVASFKELAKASKCSNPTIRAAASEILLLDSATDVAKLIREHLYDTAYIFDDYSNQKWTVISFLCHNTYHWKSEREKRDIEKLLLQKMPFEHASYRLLGTERHIDTFPGFYDIVRKMAANLLNYDYQNPINWYTGIAAVNRLASYRKREDIPLIDSLLKESLYYSNGKFFPVSTIKIFPAPDFDKYYLDSSIYWFRQFNFLKYRDYPPNWGYDSYSGIEDFINLVIFHKSAKSARLLEKILEFSPYKFAGVGGILDLEEQTRRLYKRIAIGIRENPSPYYNRLLPITKKYLKQRDLADLRINNNAMNEYPELVEKKMTAPDKPFSSYWSE